MHYPSKKSWITATSETDIEWNFIVGGERWNSSMEKRGRERQRQKGENKRMRWRSHGGRVFSVLGLGGR